MLEVKRRQYADKTNDYVFPITHHLVPWEENRFYVLYKIKDSLSLNNFLL